MCQMDVFFCANFWIWKNGIPVQGTMEVWKAAMHRWRNCREDSRITQRADGRKIAENMSNDNIDKVPIGEKANLAIKEAAHFLSCTLEI